MSFLLDTNIVSLAIKNDFYIKQKLEVMKFEEVDIYISCITYFEIRRGFLAVDAPKKRERFNQLCQKYPIIFLEGVLKVLDETDNLQKPNPPAPFPTREGGFQSLSPLRGEVWRGVCLYIKNFSNTLLENWLQ